MLNAASRIGKIYLGLLQSLQVDAQGLVRYHIQPGTPDEHYLLLLPRNLWSQAMLTIHEQGAHMAVQATVDRARHHVYFPGMLAFTQRLLLSCQQCQKKLGKVKDQRYTLVSHVSGYPFQKLSLCLLYTSPSPRDKRQSRMPSSA